MTTPRSRLLAMALVAALSLGAGGTRADVQPTALHDTSASIDDLVGRLLDALRNKDAKALRALRLTKAEYVDLILPASVPEGAELRKWPAQVNDYWWSVLHTKSTYTEANMLAGLGGHHYVVESVNYRKGKQKYATYTAYKQLELIVRDDDGAEHEIRTGSIVEMNGRYKFISFVRS